MADPAELSATELRAALGARDISAVEAVTAYLARIERGAAVNAMVTVDAAAALRRAAQLDAEGPDPSLPLFGLPVGIKDTHDTAGMRTTYGSIRHAEHVPQHDALHVRRMREAGAIVIGKTNVPEYAAGSHSVNRVFGATRNPYALDRSAGGSSGGAAAALAARQVALADGSDMGGSLRNPASFCNVVGLRPSPGVVPEAESTNLLTPLTTAGPMGRTVDDVALLLSVIGIPDARTPIAAPSLGAAGEPRDLRGLRVAWAPTLGGNAPLSADVAEVLERAVALLAEAGASVETACPDLSGAADAFLTLRAAEFEMTWGDALDADPEDFNERLTWNITQGRSLTGRDIMSAQERQTALMRGAARFFENFDVLLAPAVTVAPFPVDWDYPRTIAGEAQAHYLDWMRAATTITMLGVPALSVPAGFTRESLPVGLQMVGPFGSDHRLLGIARAYEALTGFARHSPELPTASHHWSNEAR
ncbi:amidase family protein [Leucobacter manosquensis]|uniref:Amidase n=1 Tax=Leucobacter manosquensis TaxID=2810611 RepID=A0ABS5M6L8_9MICO|nr:amidase family protein [Leucobacter manosquensis]MBS3182844.1 amidase [Leucobacter manosquensis]